LYDREMKSVAMVERTMMGTPKAALRTHELGH
jgi:hypothetical protein